MHASNAYDAKSSTPKIVVCFVVNTAEEVQGNGIAGWHVQVEIAARENTTDSILEAFQMAGNKAMEEMGDLTFRTLSI
jgi:hypothetical protein